MQLSRLGLFNVNEKAGCLERNSGAGLELFHARFICFRLLAKKLSEKVWQFGENAYLCTRKTEINAVEPK